MHINVEKINKVLLFVAAALFLFLVVFISTGCSDDKGEPADPIENGEACDSDSECLGGWCVTELTDPQGTRSIAFPGGMCSSGCDFEDETSCAEDEICVRYNPTGEMLCLVLCERPSQCRTDEGYACTSLSFFGPNACFPPIGG